MSLIRSMSSSLLTNMAAGVSLAKADLYSFTLADGITTYQFTDWPIDLDLGGGDLYLSGQEGEPRPFVKRQRWRLTNTMEVPTMDVEILADNTGFASGQSLKLAAHNGLLDGAAFALQYLYMTTSGVVDAANNLVSIFLGDVGAITIDGLYVRVTVKGRTNRLNRPTPRNIFQSTCRFGFCDTQCKLVAASYTTTNSVGSGGGGATRTFVPWGSAPTTLPASRPTFFVNGTVTFTSGVNVGQRRNIVDSDATGFTVAPPWLATPGLGDAFTALQGCSKALYDPPPADGSTYPPVGQFADVATCYQYGNVANFGGFPWVPPPDQGSTGGL